MEYRFVWECDPPPSARIPGLAGASVVLTAVTCPAGLASGLGATGLDFRLNDPDIQETYRRRSVDGTLLERMAEFLQHAAADMSPEASVEPLSDESSGLDMAVVGSSDFNVVLSVTVDLDPADAEGEVRGIEFETARSALITAAWDVRALGQRADATLFTLDDTNPGLLVDLMEVGHEDRLTGIYLTGNEVYAAEKQLFVAHFISFHEDAIGELEVSSLAAHMPFCPIAAHGVDKRRTPWAMVPQILPMEAWTSTAAPWNPLQIAREELHGALGHAADHSILSEVAATRGQLIDVLEQRGVARFLIEDWDINDLVQLGVAELTNASLQQIAIGQSTGCAFPDLEHDCPKSVFSCVFTRWQELHLLQSSEDE